MARLLLSLSVLFLTLSAVFGVLNTTKTRDARAAAAIAEQNAQAARQAQLAREKAAAATPAPTPPPADDGRIGAAEEELVRIQSEKAALQAKLKDQEAQIADLHQRLESAPLPAAGNPEPDVLPMPGAGDLQAELDDTRRQLEQVEREKEHLTEKIRSAEGTGANAAPPRRAVAARPPRPEIRGTVLAVNQAYNFVVLDVGARQGLDANAELLVLRRGTLIGKLRVSSVEPATAIGDIVSTSLARGVQVQTGDNVIYAGTNP